MTNQAFKFLENRLRNMRWQELPKRKEPAYIRVLRTKLKIYETAVAKDAASRNAARDRALTAAKEVLFAGDYEAALAAIKNVESMRF